MSHDLLACAEIVVLFGHRFDIMGEEMRGVVLDSSFLGADCTLNRSKENRIVYRVPANIESYDLKVGQQQYS